MPRPGSTFRKRSFNSPILTSPFSPVGTGGFGGTPRRITIRLRTFSASGLLARASLRHGRSRARVAANLGQSGVQTPGYTFIRSLGTGGQSEAIHVVRSRDTGEVFVAKRVSAVGRTQHHRATVEKNILLRIPSDHRNLNYVRDTFWNPRATAFTFILGYCDAGDLFVSETIQLLYI
jgi:hypothetical protein